ncbi:SLBB domain-containing protein [Cognatiyoonia sp. IB215182]|uniref:SLBB domain-containing protein n=1 Tax=Cognatiyoonia sp. IB215182 TaxID=3097353 RepID=UPI002A23B2E9|nr:SLBB domain-containing protein [Cognatiyoonia sp. IB215182]
MFATPDQRETVIEVTVSNSGIIFVPYANEIAARGLTTADLREVLLDRYRGKAVEPEIVVTIMETQTDAAIVLGDVGQPGRVSVPSSGIRLLDLMARAGGTSRAPWEVSVTIQRGADKATLPLADILDVPANNVFVRPGDFVSVAYLPRRFAVYGGVIRPSNIEIPKAEADLAYLLAEVGGLNDRVAQAKSAFVFRPATKRGAEHQGTAIAYRLDFSRPDALLLASQFQLARNDIIYVASADAADFQRFVSLIVSPLMGTVSGVSSLSN